MGRVIQSGEVTIKIGDKTHRGTWQLEDADPPEHQILTVSGDGRSKRMQLGSTPPDCLARLLLRELLTQRGG